MLRSQSFLLKDFSAGTALKAMPFQGTFGTLNFLQGVSLLGDADEHRIFEPLVENAFRSVEISYG